MKRETPIRDYTVHPVISSTYWRISQSNSLAPLH
jgi:hypothetical protein